MICVIGRTGRQLPRRFSSTAKPLHRTIRAVPHAHSSSRGCRPLGATVILAATLATLVGVRQLHAARFSGVDSAQRTAPRAPVAPAKAPATTPPADGLAETPLEAEGLGFTMRVPVGTAVRVERAPTVSYLLSDGAEASAWRLRATTVRASKVGTTARSQCEDYIADLRKRDQKFDVVADEPRGIAGTDSHLVYLGVPLEAGGRGIMGMLVVPNAPDSYLVFSLLIVDSEFARARSLLDRSFATIALRDIAKSLVENTDLMVRGAEIVAAITPEALRATVDAAPRVYRMWRPDGEGGRKDYGYMVVRVREGQLGEVDASKNPAKFEGEDKDTGLLALIDARVVVNDDPQHTLDAQSRYFVRWDRSSESWSLRSTERHKRATRSSAQTGIRLAPTTGAPRPKLQVIASSRDGMTREPQEWAVPPVYLSQAELIVLGELLPRGPAAGTIEFKDYAFDQRDQKLPQRKETWTPIEGGWRLETQQGSAPAKIVQEFDARGERVRRVDIDGSVTELIELEDLRKLWKSKGLPVD